MFKFVDDMLCRLVSHNDQIPLTSQNLTRFHSRAAPPISVLDYLLRIVKYANIDKVCLLMILVYIDRICSRNPTFTISSLTVHRFVLIAITCASKSLCDAYLSNSSYAKVGGVTTKEFNILEVEFLFQIDFKCQCSFELLQNYYVNLVRQVRLDFFLKARIQSLYESPRE